MKTDIATEAILKETAKQDLAVKTLELHKVKVTNTRELKTEVKLIYKMVSWDCANNAKTRNTTKNNTKEDPKNPPKNPPKTAKLKDTGMPNKLEEIAELKETAMQNEQLEETARLKETVRL